MNIQKHLPITKLSCTLRKVHLFNYLLFVFALLGIANLSAQVTAPPISTVSKSGSVRIIQHPTAKAAKQIVVYTDVPNEDKALLKIQPSNRFKIEVRHVGTTEWIPVFAHKTYNKNTVDDLPTFNNKKEGVKTGVANYLDHTAGWSHTYGNIEMALSSNKKTGGFAEVEVKVTRLNGAIDPTLVAAIKTYKAAAHPVQLLLNNKLIVDQSNLFVTFTINKPCQITIDFDGDMDDTNKGVLDEAKKNKHPAVHSFTLFANPFMADKPASNATDGTVLYIKPGDIIDSKIVPTAKTIYFRPGVHKIGHNFWLHKNTNYYIPGDAIVHGTFNNYTGKPRTGGADKQEPRGKNIKIFGYGTISGAEFKHPNFVEPADYQKIHDRMFDPINIEEPYLVNIEGITIVDPAQHSVTFGSNVTEFQTQKTKGPITFVRWVKCITWRGNGDGIGAAHEVSDSFFRTNDDANYIKGHKYRNIFWKDCNANVFHMQNIPPAGEFFPIQVHDNEVIYARSRVAEGWNAGVFSFPGSTTGKQAETVIVVDVEVKNFKVSDPLANIPTFKFTNKSSSNQGDQYGPMYNGLRFENVTIITQKKPTPTKSKEGCDQYETVMNIANVEFDKKVEADKDGLLPPKRATMKSQIYFKNCTINGRALAKCDFLMHPDDFNGKDITSDDRIELIFTSTATSATRKKSYEFTDNIMVYFNANMLQVDMPDANMSRDIQVYNLLGQLLYKTTTLNNTVKIDAKLLNATGVIIVNVIAGENFSSHKVLMQQ